MDILKQTVTTGNSIWERGKEVVVEGSIKLPDTFPPIASVVGVSGTAEAEQPEVSDGKVLITGRLCLSILYVDQDGEFVPLIPKPTLPILWPWMALPIIWPSIARCLQGMWNFTSPIPQPLAYAPGCI